MLAISNRRVLFHIAPSHCLCMHDVFGQRHLTTETCCKVWTQETHCSCTRHVPRRMPRPCLCTTGVMQSRTRPFICSHACSRGGNIGDTLQLHYARTKAHASSMPVYNRCNEIKNRSFICNHACSKGHGIEDTLQLHKACTKAPASSMPVHNRCNEMKNRSFLSSHTCS